MLALLGLDFISLGSGVGAAGLLALGFWLGNRHIMLAAGVVFALSGAYTFGAMRAEGRCEAGRLQADLAIAQADLAATQRAAQRDRDAIDRLTEAEQRTRRELEEYARTIASNPGCAIDADWLRRFGGGEPAANPAAGGADVPADRRAPTAAPR